MAIIGVDGFVAKLEGKHVEKQTAEEAFDFVIAMSRHFVSKKMEQTCRKLSGLFWPSVAKKVEQT